MVETSSIKLRMMKLTSLSLLFLLLISGSLYSAEAIEIVVIKSRDTAPYNIALGGFKDYLKRQHIDVRITESVLRGKRQDDLLNIREVIKSMRPDLVLSLGTPATRLARETANNIPVIYTMVLDPKAGKVSPPGVSMDIPIQIKLRHLKRILPGARRIGLIYSPNSTSASEKVFQMGGRLGFEVVGKKINSAKELPDALKELWQRSDCFLMVPDSSIYSAKSVEYLLVEGFRKNVPVIGLSSSYTKAGALFSFDCDYKDLGEQAAGIVLKILNGEDPAKIKYLGSKKINFSLNLLAAQRLDIKISSEVIKEAREVFGE